MRTNKRKGIPIVERIAAMEEWMRQYGSSALREQRHLDRDSIERAYWNYGYLIALQEALALVTDQDDSSPNDGSVDHGNKRGTSNMFH
jgi:hypothetical protein